MHQNAEAQRGEKTPYLSLTSMALLVQCQDLLTPDAALH